MAPRYSRYRDGTVGHTEPRPASCLFSQLRKTCCASRVMTKWVDAACIAYKLGHVNINCWRSIGQTISARARVGVHGFNCFCLRTIFSRRDDGNSCWTSSLDAEHLWVVLCPLAPDSGPGRPGLCSLASEAEHDTDCLCLRAAVSQLRDRDLHPLQAFWPTAMSGEETELRLAELCSLPSISSPGYGPLLAFEAGG